VIAALLANPQPHIGKIYHLTGPQSENMHFFAQEYSKALGRTITFRTFRSSRAGRAAQRGWPVHVVNHLAAMGDLHRAGRFDRLSDDVLALTGQRPLSVQEFVRKNAAAFTAAAKAKRLECLRILAFNKSDFPILKRFNFISSKTGKATCEKEMVR